MTTIQAKQPVATTPAWDTIKGETMQSATVGAITGAAGGILISGGGLGRLGFGLAGAIIGGAAGAGAGLARGAVDAHTGTGAGPALAQTGAAIVAGAAAGVGGLFLAGVVPGARQAMMSGAGMGIFIAAFAGTAAFGAAVVVPPLLDQLG